ncbi:RagB/SusD family nutrient uptake outer membrane protein [Chitinophaga sp. Cy-1792]|uniref:RagB/SusD family nutrient uptake outer membrane protein n=1 Tax=Chitinophaga sp. Cy-1792 TaxID=2608339 RepID=UPI0014212383|nr:RagB/SusD family nutrient uptake outer membrane protein [Chitinophaga sp. Cy-1792]NIG57238.1 RagB/SusD family nutrient uptake outer membrane protein [Chitinophaga sp. Cy-1792]
MKRIIIAISILSVSLFVSCNKKMDLTPNDTISTASFWKSSNDALLALNACYGYLQTGYMYAYDDGKSDNTFAQYPWESTATNISGGNIDPSMDAGYGSRYQALRSLNYFLANIDKAPVTDQVKKRYTAEARAIRAFVYYELAATFGPVPLIKDQYTDPSETAVAPAPQADVIAFSIAELQAAVTDLPASYAGGTGNETGRITSGAAWAMLTRIQLHFGKYADAVASAQKVMGLGYQLFRVASVGTADMSDDFSGYVDFASDADKTKFYKGLSSYEQQFWAANETTNKEVILASQAITNSSYVWGNGLNTLMPPSALGGWSSITPTQSLVNAYWNRNGSAFVPQTPAARATNFNDGNSNAAFYAEFKNRDTRFYASILFPSATWNRYSPGYTFTWKSGVNNNNSKTGYNFRKLVDPAYNTTEWDGAQDFPIIRYAEILLAYAEAKNEVGGPDATIYAALDDIRDRAGMPAVDQSVYNSKESLRDLIRNERRIELAGEGQRYYDIRRWNIAGNVMNNITDLNNSLVQERVWDNKFVVMPYPQSAIDRNPQLKSAQSQKGY